MVLSAARKLVGGVGWEDEGEAGGVRRGGLGAVNVDCWGMGATVSWVAGGPEGFAVNFGVFVDGECVC